jgi:putative ABC transport system substrate-binding protein
VAPLDCLFFGIRRSFENSETDRRDDTAECVGAGRSGDRMRSSRRRFLEAMFLALSAGAPALTLAQTQTVRIGYLVGRQNSTPLPGILKRLAELGYVEGKNLIIDYRSADGVAERYPSLARDLIRAKSDLIFAVGSEHAARALLEAKTNVPVVILAIDYDPVKAGLVASLRRPGGNITGMVRMQPQLAAKQLELLREIVPRAKRILVLSDPFTTEQLEAVRQAAATIRVDLIVQTFAAPPYDLEGAFSRGVAGKAEAVIALTSAAFSDVRASTARLAMKHRLPSIGATARATEVGYLLSYGVNSATAFNRAADIAVSILKGAKPGDIPVEQPTHFEVVINMKTARALGITVPPSVLVRAERIIE